MSDELMRAVVIAGHGGVERLEVREVARPAAVRASLLAAVPDNLGWAEAGAVPEAFITAHDALFTRGRLRPGERVLVHAAGSGVGLAALQPARAAGARV